MSLKFYTFFSLAVVIATVNALPPTKSNYIEQEKSCRDVCGICDCDGFYCEDECICECDLKTDESVQCVTDMKHECDKHGLEYEIIMQEAAKQRFLRQVKKDGLDMNDFSKHLVILKQKRGVNNTTAEPVVGASNPAGPVVQPDHTNDPKVAMSPSAAASASGLNAMYGLGNLNVDRLLFNMRNIRIPGLSGGRAAAPARPALPSLPSISSLPALPAFPRLGAPAPGPVVAAPTTRAPLTTRPASFSFPTISIPTLPPFGARASKN